MSSDKVQKALEARKKKKQNSTDASNDKITNALKAREKYISSNLDSIKKDISARYDAVMNEYNTNVAGTSKIYGDSANELYNNQRKNSLEVSNLMKDVEAYRKYFDADAVDGLFASLEQMDNGYKGLLSASLYKTEDEFDTAVRLSGYSTKYQGMTPEEEAKVIEDLNLRYAEASAAGSEEVKLLQEEIDFLYNYGSKESQIAGRKKQYDYNNTEISRINAEINALESKVGNSKSEIVAQITAIENTLNERKRYYRGRVGLSEEKAEEMLQNTSKKELAELAELRKKLEQLAPYDDLVAQRDALVAENNRYDRGEGTTDKVYTEYKHIMEKPDYAKFSQTGESKLKWGGLAGDDTYDYINDINGLRNKQSANAMRGGGGNPNKIYDTMTDDEIGVYNYLYATEGKDSANAYLKKLESALQVRSTEANAAFQQKMVNESSLYATVANIGSVVTKPFGEAMAFVDNTVNQAQGKEINPYSDWQTLRNTNNAIRESTTQVIEANTDAEFLGQNVWGQIYNAGMSTLDSLYGATLFGTWYTVVAGSGAAANKAAELYEKGATSDQIFWGGTAAGLAEAAFEYISIGNLIKAKNPDKWYKIFWEAFKQAGIEGSEELATEIANIASDNAIMGSQSDFNLAIKAYQNEGLSYDEAYAKAKQDKLNDIIWAGLSGFMSGGASGGITTTHQGISNAVAGKGIKKQGDTDAMIMAGIDASQDSQAYKLAEKAFRDYTEGDALYRFAEKVTGADSKITQKLSNKHGKGNVSNMQLGALKQTTMEDVVDQYRNREQLSESDIQAKLESKGIDSKKAAEFASIVAKVAKGDKLSERETEALKSNEDVQNIANEIASAEAVNNFATRVQLAKIDSLGREATPETPDTYDVSKTEGKTLMKDSGAEVNIEDIASIKDGKMMLKVNDGTEVKEVNAENISFATNQEAILYETVAQMDIDATSAKAIIGNFDAKSDMSAGKYIYGAYEAFRYGKYNFSPEEMSKNGFSADLTEEQKTFAYNLGKNVQVSNVNAQEGAIKKAIEGAKTDNKAKGDKKGEVIYEDGKTALTDRQDASVKALEVVAKALGINIYLYESTLDDKGRRAYIDKDGKRITANGWYDPNTGDIHIDINAGQGGEGVMLFTAAHELTHFIRQWSPAKFKVLADFLMAEYGKEGVPVAELVRYQQDLAAKQGRKLSYDQAYEEMIADSMQTMLSDGAVVEKLAKLAKKDKTLVEKMKEKLDELVKAIKREYAKETPYSEAGEYAAMLNEGERLQELFYDALVSAGENYRGAGGKTNIANAEMRLMARELGNDLGTIERTDNGDIALITNKDNSLVLYSPRTYEEGGRDKLEATLKANGHTQEEINDTLKLLDDASDYMRILAAGYAKMNYGKLGERLSEHLEATVTTDLKGHKQVLSTLVNNGDYPVNLDLALICKKRVAYMRLMTRLIEDGVFGDVVYGGDAIAEVNAILREDGFETACLGCFVESRRLQFQTWAETIVQEWNEAVDAHTKNAGYFGFAKGGKGNLTEADMDAMEAELKGQKRNDKGNVNLGQGSAVARMNRLLDKTPSLAKKLTVDDLLTPQGLTTLRKADGNLFSLVKSRYGAASPKIVQEFSPYASEIANLTFNYVKKMTGESIKGGQQYIKDAQKELAAEKPVKEKGESKEDFKARKKAWDGKVETLAMNNYLFAIGGARIQSFSDFMIENVFDYIQIMADLVAKGSPLHGYTKEIACLRLFGMTGAKWNGSLIAHVEKSMGKEMAGLMPASEAKNGNAILVHTPKGDYAIGFDDYARHMVTNKKSFIQSIGMKDIVALMLDPRYSANVGNITIGVSDMQIFGMLDSPLFRMVIPYHASGMLPQFAQLVGVDFYNDYTNYQNTTVKKYFDLEGNPVESLGDKAKVDTSFKYNEEVQKLAKSGVKDAPRQAANNYIAWCGKMHPVYEGKKRVGYATFNPKFSDSPYGTDFSKHKNYYKLLEDFNMYDNNTESAAMQEAVKMVLPSEANRLNAEQMEAYKQALRDTGIFTEADITKYAKKADMTFEEIIKAEMDNRQAYEEETDPKWDATVKKVEDHLKKHHPRDGQAKSAEDYKKAKGDSAISKIKAVDGSYAIQIADNEIKRSERDSEGNALTEAQQEYFKDSKVRDKKGNLLVLYHGTNAHFTVFNSNHSDDKMSFFLTDSPDVAHSYARSDMILNPYDFLDEDATPNKVADVAEKVVSNWESVKVVDSKSAEKANKTIINSIADVKSLIDAITELTENTRIGRSFFMQSLLSSSKMFDSWIQTGDVFARQNPFEATTTKAASLLTLESEGVLELSNEVIDAITDLIDITTPMKPLFDIANAYADGGAVFEVTDHLGNTSYVSEVMARKNINWAQSGGLMPLYANLKNPLIVEAGGRRWNNIKRLSEMDESYPETINTRMVSDFANKNGYDGVIFKGLVDMGGRSTVKSQRSTVVVAFDSNQLKSTQNTNPTSDPDIRYSSRDYSYEALTNKPDMQITTVGGTVPNNRADVVVMAKKNAASVGKFHKDGSVSVYVDDIGTEVILSKKGLVHGLDRRLQEIAPVTVHAGEIIKNSIKINELIPSKKEADASYVLIGAAQNANGDMYIVRFVVNKYSNELTTMDVLYAINAKKSTAALNAPLVSTPNYRTEELAALNAPRLTAKPLSVTNSTISIAELLDYVNKYFPDVLPESVLRHYQHDRRPEGELGENALYSERDPNATSNRSLLANALEDAVQNDIEKNKLQQYKEKIDFINAEERKLADLNRQLKELRFSKGKRDTIKTKQINDLQAEATKTANRISIYDKQLLNLEASKPLKNILEREKIKARKKQKQRDAEILQEQKDKANATIREIMNRHTESRKKATEGRHKTVVRNKIKRTINDLNSVFNRGTKDRNVKIGLRDTVRKALEASEVLFSDEITNEDIVRLGVDSVSEQDSEKLNRYATLLALRETKEDAVEISRINSQISRLNSDLKDVFIRERARLNKESVSTALDSLAEAYASLQNSDDDYIKNNAFVQGMHDRIKSLSENLNGVTIKDMSLEQLEEVYKMYSSVKHMIVNANSIFRDGLREDLSKKILTVQGEILELQKDNRKDPRVIVDAINNAIKSFDWNNQKPVYAFEKLGSQAFQELFWDAIKAEGVYAQDVVEAGEFLDAQKDKFKYADWDFKKAKTFKSANGLDFKLTLSDMMSIYAYSKRPQAFEHMTQGGFTFDRGSVYVDEKGRKRKHVRLSETYTVSIELINEIVKTLSEEQISYVDAVQAYLTSLGEKGNEISRVLYGIDLFTEKVYFPLKSDADYRSSVEQALNETQTQVSLKNTGMTKQTVPHANNPIVLQGFDDVVLGHIDNMSKYHSFVLPIENLRRVFDNVSKDENASYDATKVIIESVFGESAKQYFDQYITDLNGGVHIGGYQNIMMDMFSKMKKTAVSASLSVVVQQPFAITRAMDMINPVYFAPVNLNAAKKHTDTKSQWEELKKYAPVAIIKEMGGFDVGSSRTTRDYIGGTNYKGLGGKVKGFFKDSDYRNASLDNMFMWGAAKADEIGWSTIWKAVKNEVASQHKELAVGSEEFLKKCGERFTEVVVYTQVYDSVNSRSGMMRSKRDLDKFATSFMGEPTTTINMVENSMLKLARAVKTKDGKAIAKASAKMGRTVGVTLGSILLTSLAKSLVYAGRDDDDEDKALLERWSKHFGDSLKSDLNPLTMIPYLRDFVSIWEGWDVERPDMTVVADIVTSIKKAIEEGCTLEEALALIGNAGNAFGLPVKNIIREVQGVINVFGDITDNIEPTDIGSAFAEGWTGEEQSNKDALYKAIINGDEAKMEAIKAEYKTEDAYEKAIRKGLRENDPRIKEAAQARIDGDISKYSSIVREIKAEGHFSQDTIVAAVNAEINLINKEAKEQNAGGNDEIEDTEEKATSIYKASDINAAFENGDTNMALTIINDLVETKVSNGMTEKEAKSSVKSSMTSYWKSLFLEAYNNKDAAEQKRIRQILIASGLYGRTSEVIETTQQWIKNSKKTK